MPKPKAQRSYPPPWSVKRFKHMTKGVSLVILGVEDDSNRHLLPQVVLPTAEAKFLVKCVNEAAALQALKEEHLDLHRQLDKLSVKRTRSGRKLDLYERILEATSV